MKNNQIILPIILSLIFVLSLSGVVFYFQSQINSLKTIKISPTPFSTPIPTITNSTSTWQTYQDESVRFQYPSGFTEIRSGIYGSHSSHEFEDNFYSFTFSIIANYNQMTGKPYANIKEYVGLSYDTSVVVFDGRQGRQMCPRAGCENIFSSAVFSDDSKSIYELSLQAGKSSLSVSEQEIEDARKLYNQILSTFKFTTPVTSDTSTWQTYKNDQYGFEFKYPQNLIIKEEDWESRKLYLKRTIPGYHVISVGADGDNISYDLRIYNNKSQINLREWIEQKSDYCGPKNEIIPLNQKTSIGAFKIIGPYQSCSSTGGDGGTDTSTFFSKGNQIYDWELFFSYLVSLEDNQAHRPIYDQILSTFKFIN